MPACRASLKWTWLHLSFNLGIHEADPKSALLATPRHQDEGNGPGRLPPGNTQDDNCAYATLGTLQLDPSLPGKGSLSMSPP